MGMAFADELFTRDSKLQLTIVDRRARAGGHWVDAYPFVRLHQPAAFYGVNSLVLGNGTTDLSSKTEILDYYNLVMGKFEKSGRVAFLSEHEYKGDGQVVDVNNPDKVLTYKVNKRIVDATYMKVEVPSTHKPKYEVEDGVSLIPINELVDHHDKWDDFYVIGNGKTGMDAVLFLLDKGVPNDNIHWICPNQAWFFNRDDLQVGKVASVVLKQVSLLRKTKNVNDLFLKSEGKAGIDRLDNDVIPKKWRCATVSSPELEKLRDIKNIIKNGRVTKITTDEVILQQGSISYSGKSLFVDCSANALSREKKTPIFSTGKITLQSILFCQQVFSAAAIARMEMTNISDAKKNVISPVPHPEFKEDWPLTLAETVENLILLHRQFPLWMFRSRLNFMSHESIFNYFYYSIKAARLNPGLHKKAKRMHQASLEVSER